MADSTPGFGPFGTGKPTVRKRSRMGFVIFFLGILLSLALYFRVHDAVSNFYNGIAERTAPVVSIPDPPFGIGTTPVELTIQVGDAGAGLDQVIVRATQAKQTRDLFRKSYPTKVTDDLIQIPINAKELGLYEGDLQITVIAFDRSFWSNTSRASAKLQIDYEFPEIEVLTKQHNAVQGGVELVFYRLTNDSNAFSGIIVGSLLFPGFPAISLDSAFRETPDVYFALFAIPLDFDSDQSKIRLLARDNVGNTTTTSIYYRVRERKGAVRTLKVTQAFLEQAVERTYEQYLLTEPKVGGVSEREYFPAIKNSERVERFTAVNEEYRKLVEEAAKPLFARPKGQMFWRGVFGRPPGRQLSLRFGDTLNWMFEDTLLGTTRVEELLYIAPSGRAVGAANSGKVVFVDEFGPYGKTVIVDHGFGLSTMYSHLASYECTEGDELAKGGVVGRAGASGLIPKSGVGFQFRLHGVPVRPEEWWDAKWITDHIDKKIREVKRELGIRVIQPLGP